MINKEFDSITQVASFLKCKPQVTGAGNESVNGSASRYWDLEAGFDGAMDFAAKGGYWPEGAKNIQQCHIEVSKHTSSKTLSLLPDVTGHTLDMDEYLSGSPECWLSDDPESELSKPVLRVGVASDALAGVNSESMMMYGAAALALIDTLESKGYQVELYATWCSTHGKDVCISTQTLVKGAGESWSPSSVAFTLAHPAFNRRLMFGVCERFAHCNRITNGGGYGGLPSHRQTQELYDFDVYIPGYAKNCRDAEHAMSFMLEQFEDQLGEKING